MIDIEDRGKRDFGPRGLATIVFTTMLIDTNMPGADAIALTAACTIIFSVVAHGVTARPLIRALDGKPKRTRDADASPP